MAAVREEPQREFGGRILTAFDPNRIFMHQKEAPVQPPLAQLDETFEDARSKMLRFSTLSQQFVGFVVWHVLVKLSICLVAVKLQILKGGLRSPNFKVCIASHFQVLNV
ncbi:Hypothetical predicted protein [Cloeon dipterum]|uniref:Uncharacterized protein n=1 Tax=Cloeon dipterum TaxID=197152 RepID=A0A8S1BTM1_9INSE|nr:Hypothetical predicted protein [Cloeon dipterum]